MEVARRFSDASVEPVYERVERRRYSDEEPRSATYIQQIEQIWETTRISEYVVGPSITLGQGSVEPLLVLCVGMMFLATLVEILARMTGPLVSSTPNLILFLVAAFLMSTLYNQNTGSSPPRAARLPYNPTRALTNSPSHQRR
ncbi:hypothetical protein F4806DRAFT_497759 [Annulohypoxylon nitens]|nr:hypothetical protein F4806DRAFT_497759 [Annulohypoxylon nitens]